MHLYGDGGHVKRELLNYSSRELHGLPIAWEAVQPHEGDFSIYLPPALNQEGERPIVDGTH